MPQKAVEKDDLSLLGGMKEDERKEYNSKGIFTVTQLSYTFGLVVVPTSCATKRRSITNRSKHWRFG